MKALALTLGFGLALTALPVVAQAANTAEDVCETTATIVTEAQAMRVAGKSGAEAVAALTEQYADRSEAFRAAAIPMLVNDFVYLQPESVLTEDLGAVWKTTCLSADLSSVLPAD
jgi:hypothetical protein